MIEEAIEIDEGLKVQLQFGGKPVSLPTWFVSGRSAILDGYALLNNFPNYLQSFHEKHKGFNMLHELNNRQFFQPKGGPPFSSSISRFALLLRYTSAALPSTSLILEKFRSNKVASLKAARLLKTQNKISTNVVLLVGEKYWQKCAQYAGGECLGADFDGNLYNLFRHKFS